MNKSLKKIFAFCGLVSLMNVSIIKNVNANENTYITWNKEITYEIKNTLDKLPTTYECKIQVPTSVSNAGSILSNRAADTNDFLSFEITTGGNPYLYFRHDNTRYATKFTNVDVRSNDFVHLVITTDAVNDLAYCYVNGELKQSVSYIVEDYALNSSLMLAGDKQSNNPNYFKGVIDSVALYSDLRTTEEIAGGMNTFENSDSDMMLGYSLVNLEDDYIIEDKSQNDRDVKKIVTWVDEEDIVGPGEFDYSFAVVGDTQYACKNYGDKFHKIYDYILDNVDNYNIQHVFGLGDITDASTRAEWELADEHISRMDGVVPYSLVRGNHDGEQWFDYVFGPETKYNNQYYNQYFDNYLNYRNTAHEFSTDILDYLVITLDFGATDDVLDWAAGIIEEHPNHNVIITTHAYLASDGTTLDATDSGRPSEYGSVYNDGDEMWDKLVSKYENIVLVLSGHIGSDDILYRQDKGVHGNTVTQFLINPQYVDSRLGGVGLVSMFYISDGGRKVVVDYYSTYVERYFKLENQFDFELDVVERKQSNPNGGNSGGNTSSSTNNSTITSTSSSTSNTTTSSGGGNTNDGNNNTLVIVAVAVAAVIAVGGTLFFVFRKKD